MEMVLVGTCCFLAGAFCFYWPFRKWRQKISALIPSAFSSPIPSSLKEVTQIKSQDSSLVNLSYLFHQKTKLGRFLSQLEFYITDLKDQNKKIYEKLFLSKKISHEISLAIQEFVIILDKKGQVLFHNPQSHQIFYLEKKAPAHLQINEMVRSTDVINLFEECLHTQTRLKKKCYFRKKNQNIKSYFEVTAIPIFKSSSSYKEWESQGSSPLSHTPTPDESLQKIILLFDDQTAIQESQQAHIDFVSNVSHELKTPLTALQGYVEMLIQDFAHKNMDQFENFLQILLKNCKRMNDLVNDLLILSNLISQADVQKKKLRTKEVTKKVINNIKTETHKLHCSFLSDYVTGHPLWVETVLHNLLDNACRHTPAQSDVHILWEKSQNKVFLRVRDTGEGIPEKYQQRVFERFFRIDPARSRLKGGTGVGLSLVKQALEKQGGSVRVVSSPSRGAEFICEFPN